MAPRGSRKYARFYCSLLQSVQDKNWLDDTANAEIFVRTLISYISYFWLKVQNLVAHKTDARIPVYVTPPSLHENL